eukprot:scaffold28009_cov66-Attheya_sp.AAC.1
MTGCPAWVTREVRNTIAAWYPMGYIPDLDQQSSSRKKTSYTKKRQGRECVYLLRVKMEEIYENTKSDDAAVVKQAKRDLHELSQHGMELAT